MKGSWHVSKEHRHRGCLPRKCVYQRSACRWKQRLAFQVLLLVHLCLVLDSEDYADALPAAVDHWIFRFDDSLEDFDANYGRVVSAEDESFEDLYLARTDKKLHLGLNAGASLSLDPS